MDKERFGGFSWQIWGLLFQLPCWVEDYLMGHGIGYKSIGAKNDRDKGYMGTRCEKKQEVPTQWTEGRQRTIPDTNSESRTIYQ